MADTVPQQCGTCQGVGQQPRWWAERFPSPACLGVCMGHGERRAANAATRSGPTETQGSDQLTGPPA